MKTMCPNPEHGPKAALFPLWTGQSEAEFQSNVIEMASALGWRHYHTHDSRRSPGGFPDLVLVRRGRLVFAELKRVNERLRDDQREWIEDIAYAERIVGLSSSQRPLQVYVWRPCDMDEIEGVLR